MTVSLVEGACLSNKVKSPACQGRWRREGREGRTRDIFPGIRDPPPRWGIGTLWLALILDRGANWGRCMRKKAAARCGVGGVIGGRWYRG